MGPASAPHGGFSSEAKSLRASKFAETCLWAVGVAALGYCGYIWSKGWIAQYQGNRELDRSLSEKRASGVTRAGTPAALPELGSLVGRVEIPRLEVSAVVFEGTDDDVLDLGVGHLRGTALPGDDGNVVLAAHRDTFFRGLRKVREHDIVTLTTASGPRRYQVDSTRIVSPFDTAVAGPTPQPTLTLITCYPFEFLGHAPERFIVQAREIVESRQPAPSGIVPVGYAPPAKPIAKTIPKPAARRKIAREQVTAPPNPIAVALADEPVRTQVQSPVSPAGPLAQENPSAAEIAATTADDPTPVSTPAPQKHKLGWMNPVRIIKKIPHPGR